MTTNNTTSSLKPVEGFYYLASPYSEYAKGRDRAFEDVNMVAADLMRHGFCVYAPISHGHPISETGGLDQEDFAFWMRQCHPMMDAAEGLIVARLEGWDTSKGVIEEIETFQKAGKPVFYVDP